MNILGEKVILRAIELTDSELLKSMMNDSETEFMLLGWSFPVSDFNQEEWIKSINDNKQCLRCMIDDSKTGITIGTIILSELDYKNGTAQIHIKLLKEFQNQGYATEAVKSMVKYSFDELRLQCVYAYINEYNTSSIRLFSRCGFHQEGLLRNRIYKHGNYHNCYIYSILKGE